VGYVGDGPQQIRKSGAARAGAGREVEKNVAAIAGAPDAVGKLPLLASDLEEIEAVVGAPYSRFPQSHDDHRIGDPSEQVPVFGGESTDSRCSLKVHCFSALCVFGKISANPANSAKMRKDSKFNLFLVILD
jgi:hypothetical protein